jgi:hypothetical protein
MTDEPINFHKLALSESFERVAKVAEEREAFNEQMPKPDPLVEVIEAARIDPKVASTQEYADAIRAALEARGFEIREKGQ